MIYYIGHTATLVLIVVIDAQSRKILRKMLSPETATNKTQRDAIIVDSALLDGVAIQEPALLTKFAAVLTTPTVNSYNLLQDKEYVDVIKLA
jgi:hypothetical protein